MTDIEVEYDDPDAELAEAVEIAEAAGCQDVASFIERMDENGYTDDDGTAEVEGLEDMTLPFTSDERAIIALMAFAAGSAIERKYGGEEPSQREVTSVQG